MYDQPPASTAPTPAAQTAPRPTHSPSPWARASAPAGVQPSTRHP